MIDRHTSIQFEYRHFKFVFGASIQSEYDLVTKDDTLVDHTSNGKEHVSRFPVPNRGRVEHTPG